MNNGGVVRGRSVFNYAAAESATKVRPGDVIALTRSDFERLAAAFLR
jgi:hypothetical protein